MEKTITLKIEGSIRSNDMRELLMAFFPYENLQVSESKEEEWGHLEVEESAGKIRAVFQDGTGNKFQSEERMDPGSNLRQTAKKQVYDLLVRATDRKLKWGTMTGIRPVRIAHEALLKKTDLDDIRSRLKNDYRLSEEAIAPMLHIARLELERLYPLDRHKAQVYINIPFCPSRCSYCSFITQEAGTDRELLDDYLKALVEEIRILGTYLQETTWEVESIYVGGGTPTVLEPNQLELLLGSVEQYLPMKYLTEYTLEGGRPDTITEEKLRVLRKYKVDRISVNPQSMQAETLDRLGRGHSVEDFYHAYGLVRDAGFSSVNCDLILGLEEERAEEMIKSARSLLMLEPENITIHSLFLKRSSALAAKKEDQTDGWDKQGQEAALAAKTIYQLFEEKGYEPYYLYRQKYCVNNGENIGFAKRGKECFYNMAIMSDKRTVIGLGAGSTGKVYDPKTDGYERMETVKNVTLYVKQVLDEGDRKVKQLRLLD
ncbi:coproporphyrinogen dehydrogenase HemZ [Alkalibacter rhizosphaerae]|uniref:Coproporphyrinogen dehydrogenase HemZ n=1 Tax=Alkalibacter rhizosphaerae TaxID=2815577 RepID=A0A975AIQ3_9FIRM|nr:coproporphyrinogen dehydrogenase HemZ [Alkalibacter rhizosphaerae]QSX08770.1 coproporphyrinogen dehydrogenase HemZ [Alkalibacter rhizosphaerae]